MVVVTACGGGSGWIEIVVVVACCCFATSSAHSSHSFNGSCPLSGRSASRGFKDARRLKLLLLHVVSLTTVSPLLFCAIMCSWGLIRTRQEPEQGRNSKTSTSTALFAETFRGRGRLPGGLTGVHQWPISAPTMLDVGFCLQMQSCITKKDLTSFPTNKD